MIAVAGALKLFFTNGSTIHVGADEFKLAAKKAFTPLDQTHWAYVYGSTVAQTILGMKMMGMPPLDALFDIFENYLDGNVHFSINTPHLFIQLHVKLPGVKDALAKLVPKEWKDMIWRILFMIHHYINIYY